MRAQFRLDAELTRVIPILFMPPPFSMGFGGVGGGGIYYHRCPYIHPSRPVTYVTLLVSVRYLLKGLVYWIEILYTGI